MSTYFGFSHNECVDWISHFKELFYAFRTVFEDFLQPKNGELFGINCQMDEHSIQRLCESDDKTETFEECRYFA